MPLVLSAKDLERIFRVLDLIASAPGHPDLLGAIGAEVEDQTRARLKTKRDPDGKAWKGWSPRYAAGKHGVKSHAPHPGQLRQAGGHSLLVLHGHLQNSIESIVKASARSVEVGSDRIYANRQNEARQFLGLGYGDREDVYDTIGEFFDREVARL